MYGTYAHNVLLNRGVPRGSPHLDSNNTLHIFTHVHNTYIIQYYMYIHTYILRMILFLCTFMFTFCFVYVLFYCLCLCILYVCTVLCAYMLPFHLVLHSLRTYDRNCHGPHIGEEECPVCRPTWHSLGERLGNSLPAPPSVSLYNGPL